MHDNPITVISYTTQELNRLAAEGLLSSYLAPLMLLILVAHLRRQHSGRRPGNFAHKQGYRST